jgi:SulP family sulfate permease
LNARLAARLEPARRWLAGESVFFARPAAVLRGYDRAANLKPDLVAGLAVAVVLLPQAIAFATLAELPPQMGLYTGVVAAIVGALWGSSRLLQTGPTNTSSMLIFATLLIAATPGTEDYVRAAGYLAVMVGLLRLTMGLLRLGVLVHFVADSVIVGFTAGAGVLIMINEMRHVLRLEIPSVPELGLTVRMILLRIEFVHWPSVALALGAFLVALLFKRGGPRMPGAFVAMAAAGVATGAARPRQPRRAGARRHPALAAAAGAPAGARHGPHLAAGPGRGSGGGHRPGRIDLDGARDRGA